MNQADLEARVAALEVKLARLKERVEKPLEPAPYAWKQLVGKYADDPIFDEAMRLGREYRESTRPKVRKPRKV